MLDSDVAMLYQYETKNINKSMKRNIDRFPEDFCFQLTKEELEQMWFQNGTTKIMKTEKFHDRFIIIDNRKLYHCGASIKDLGKKCFGINEIEDKTIIEKIISA